MSHTCEDCRYFDREWCAFHRECVVGCADVLDEVIKHRFEVEKEKEQSK